MSLPFYLPLSSSYLSLFVLIPIYIPISFITSTIDCISLCVCLSQEWVQSLFCSSCWVSEYQQKQSLFGGMYDLSVDHRNYDLQPPW
mmetsp:Transcript_23535/g.33704  ORF Transcript_23535/g.33704 Transcript_23535/m.33704 type:complete len:87 (+) Transcript_23535:118-378(+)